MNKDTIIRLPSPYATPLLESLITIKQFEDKMRSLLPGLGSYERRGKQIDYFNEGCKVEVQTGLNEFKPAILRINVHVEFIEEKPAIEEKVEKSDVVAVKKPKVASVIAE